MRTMSIVMIALWLGFGPAFAQQGTRADEVSKGHHLAVMICSICHLAAPDQARLPRLKPPGPSFASIAQRPGTDEQSLTTFITTTHRGLDKPAGMPNPDLAPYQVKEVIAYILSLRK
jgi:mono/diheme cytochrome c family protein